ncbi:MAG: argininosuccinate synthase [Bacteroidetes bacterium]|nr:MAG: argininosuccinate synthase [Bacteroidota bacterium]
MPIVLAFSGGLDTSFCVPFLKETYGEDVITVTVNTGGFTTIALKELERRSIELGAAEHITVEARDELFRDHISYLIKGNVLRGNVYPLCVGPERVVQARHVAEQAKRLNATAIAHGSTGAGNDQVRFDVAMTVLADDINLIAPIREHGFSRSFTTSYLFKRGFGVSASTTSYSINAGLWGTTIGGKETLTPEEPLPESAWVNTKSPSSTPEQTVQLRIEFEQGIPVAVDGTGLDPVSLVERLTTIGNEYGVGRGVHVGDTILGIKGRVACEAPAASILINAHRELEKVVLGKWQRFQKDQLAEFYGMLLHEGQYLDPVMADIRAMIDSSQERVSGVVTVELYKGSVRVLGCASPHSMFASAIASYGESNTLWNGRDAQGFSKIVGIQSVLTHQTALTQ